MDVDVTALHGTGEPFRLEVGGEARGSDARRWAGQVRGHRASSPSARGMSGRQVDDAITHR